MAGVEEGDGVAGRLRGADEEEIAIAGAAFVGFEC